MASSLTAQAGPVPYNFMESAVVTMFGADKTGVANSSAAFIAAANALTSGGVVVIPPGKYIVEGLPIRDGLYYVGAGVGKTDGSTGTSRPQNGTFDIGAYEYPVSTQTGGFSGTAAFSGSVQFH